MSSRSLIFVVASLFATNIAIGASEHDVEIDTFATIMAVTRTAAERCPGVTIDEDVIIVAKDRLHVLDGDYFAFRAKAHRKVEPLESLAGGATRQTWCDEAIVDYGPEGTRLRGALRR